MLHISAYSILVMLEFTNTTFACCKISDELNETVVLMKVTKPRKKERGFSQILLYMEAWIM